LLIIFLLIFYGRYRLHFGIPPNTGAKHATVFSRYEIIHETLRKFYKALDESDLRKKMGRNDREDLKNLLSEEGEKVIYRSTKEEVQSRMQTLGLLIYRLL